MWRLSQIVRDGSVIWVDTSGIRLRGCYGGQQAVSVALSELSGVTWANSRQGHYAIP
jgi:hypothetical protein